VATIRPGDAVLEDRRVLKDRSDRIDRDSPVLLADQVAQDLRNQVAVGRMSGRLPSEVEMASLYGVSRVTVRRAVAALAAEGKLTVIHGRGTFIARAQ
jgi:DNA-binding GntR family transcriptional regulator